MPHMPHSENSILGERWNGVVFARSKPVGDQLQHALSADISVGSQVPQMRQHWNKDFLKMVY